MTLIVRRHCITLILMIAISHITLVAHSAGHNDASVVPCQLCLCQAQQAYGLPPAILRVNVVSCNCPPDDTPPLPSWQHEVIHTYYQRAPPLIT